MSMFIKMVSLKTYISIWFVNKLVYKSGFYKNVRCANIWLKGLKSKYMIKGTVYEYMIKGTVCEYMIKGTVYEYMIKGTEVKIYD